MHVNATISGVTGWQGIFYDLSKLSFAGLVIGVITPLFTDEGAGTNIFVIVIGLVLTVLSAMLANKILR